MKTSERDSVMPMSEKTAGPLKENSSIIVSNKIIRLNVMGYQVKNNSGKSGTL